MKINSSHLVIIALAFLALICFGFSAYQFHFVYTDKRVEIKYINVTVNSEDTDFCKVYNNTLVVVFQNGKVASINLPGKIGYNESSYLGYSITGSIFATFGVLFFIITIAKYYELKGDC